MAGPVIEMARDLAVMRSKASGVLHLPQNKRRFLLLHFFMIVRLIQFFI
jgi:hypothetical protein